VQLVEPAEPGRGKPEELQPNELASGLQDPGHIKNTGGSLASIHPICLWRQDVGNKYFDFLFSTDHKPSIDRKGSRSKMS
jgi:hypothetical protein